MQTDTAFIPTPGKAEHLDTGLRRILAPNPSPMTYLGTNTYLLGQTDLAVIDPGPDSAAHLQAILAALTPGQRISHIFVTHAHLDHSPLARRLSAKTGAPVFAFGDAMTGRSAVMKGIAGTGLVGGGEGVDTAFTPDITLADGESVQGDGWRLTAHWTPGHFGNHLCFAVDDVVFTGDLVMGWASSLVSPPDGDLTDFMASCERLRGLNTRVFHAGHGAPINDPRARLDWLISHRRGREVAILTHLADAPATATQLARQIYTDIPVEMMPAATRNVLAHLIDLHGKNMLSYADHVTADTIFHLRA